jgi:hypothetical protein
MAPQSFCNAIYSFYKWAISLSYHNDYEAGQATLNHRQYHDTSFGGGGCLGP